MPAALSVLGRDYTIDCTEAEERRLLDLARALEERLQTFGDEADTRRSLIVAALALLDEAQAAGAALARAHGEIERLNDMVVEAKLEAAANDDRGRTSALRPQQGAA